MEPIEPVRTAEMRSAHTADLGPARLCLHRTMVVQRMLIRESPQHLPVIDVARRIQRDAELLPRPQTLQPVQVVGHGGRRIEIAREPVVPGRTGPPLDAGGDDESREAMHALVEPAEELTITATEAEIVIAELYGTTRNLHPNGKPYKTDNGTAEIKALWNEGKLVVEKKNPRGGKLVETWELVPDGSRILLNVKLDGGFGPALALKRVYDRAKEGAAP